MAQTSAAASRWPAPQKIRWPFWISLYLLALAVNRHYAPKLVSILSLPKLTLEQSWLLAAVPALVVVTLALVLRWCWYQSWLIYHQANQILDEEAIQQNQRYWAEHIRLQEVIFCCGTLRSLEEFGAYQKLPVEERQQITLNAIRQKMVLPAQEVAIQSRQQGILLQLAIQLKQRHYLTTNHSQFLWVWLGDAASWALFRQQARACGGVCPVQPDRYLKDLDINWLIDRAQEADYQQILVLGYECSQDLELYLALIFAPEGEMAQLGRGFALAHWPQQQASFVATLSQDIGKLQLASSALTVDQVQAWTKEKSQTVSAYTLNIPAVFAQAGDTRPWLWLLCVLDDLHSSTLIIEEQDQLLTVSPAVTVPE